MRRCLLFAIALGLSAFGAEERIRGVLEKTARPDACAQITDVLDETYYVNKSDATERMIAKFLGRNIPVVVTGTVENKPGTQGLYFNLKSVEQYTPPEKKDGAKK